MIFRQLIEESRGSVIEVDDGNKMCFKMFLMEMLFAFVKKGIAKNPIGKRN